MKSSLKSLKSLIYIFIPLALVTIFVTLLVFFAPIKESFEYNSDEGIDSMKTQLYSQGFALYKQIWNDQPPLFTVMLSLWFKLFGPSIYAARIMVLLFSGLLLFSFYQTIRISLGNLAASAGLILLALSTAYSRLSVSVMLGTPALAQAMLSICLLTAYLKYNARRYIFLSAVSMAFSLQTKFFTAFLVPLAVFEIIRAKKQNHSRLWAVSRWLVIFLILYTAIAFIYFGFNSSLLFKQLFRPHLNKLDLSKNSPLILIFMLLQDYDIALLALMGAIFGIIKKDSRLTLPSGWLLLASLILIIHRPIWYHYYLLISIPLCWLAAIGISHLFASLGRTEWLPSSNKHNLIAVSLRWITAVCIILALVNLPVKLERSMRHASVPPWPEQRSIVSWLEKYRNQTRWIVTDMPTAAFYAHLLVPPEIAVASIKRVVDEDYFISLLEKYRPEQILIGNLYKYTDKVMTYIQNRYSQAYQCVLTYETQNYVPCDYALICIWKPLGQYIPFHLLHNRRLYNLAWNNLRVPTFGMRKIKHFSSRWDKTIKLFIRKDILSN